MWWRIVGGWAWVVAFVIAWFITNGWAYIFLTLGGTLRVIGAAWLTILWMPLTPEKIVTVALATIIKKYFIRPRAEIWRHGKYETSSRNTLTR